MKVFPLSVVEDPVQGQHLDIYTSVINIAVRYLMSLCLIDGIAPLGQLKACSTEKLEPQTQCDGILDGFYPYQNIFHPERTPYGGLNCAQHWAVL